MKTRAEADLVKLFVDAFASRKTHADDLALARRLLSHEQSDVILAGLLRDHLGARPDALEEATAARRAGPPLPPPPPARNNGAAPAPRKSNAGYAGAERSAAEPPKARKEPDVGAAKPKPARNPPPEDVPAAASVVDVGTLAFEADEPSSTSDAVEPDFGTERKDLTEIFVNVGRRDGVTPRDFYALLEAKGLGDELTGHGYVKVKYRHSFVAVRRPLLEQAIDALSGATIAGKQAMAEPSRGFRA
jgi:hypothetical protein